MKQESTRLWECRSDFVDGNSFELLPGVDNLRERYGAGAGRAPINISDDALAQSAPLLHHVLDGVAASHPIDAHDVFMNLVRGSHF